jgi:hypothetical protein
MGPLRVGVYIDGYTSTTEVAHFVAEAHEGGDG